jgi:hypothetical protein
MVLTISSLPKKNTSAYETAKNSGGAAKLCKDT